MSKRDERRAKFDGNVGEVDEVGSAPVEAPEIPKASGKHDGVKRSKDVAEIALSRIAPDPGQPRKEFDDEALLKLAASLRKNGQIQPIRVRWAEDLGSYLIIVGERRWRAAALADLPTLTCVVHEGELSEQDLRAIQVVENLNREELRPLEVAHAIRDLVEKHGWTQERVGAELGLGQAAISKYSSLLELTPEVRGKVESGAISPAAGYQLAAVEDPAEQAELAAKVESGELNRDELAAEVKASPSRKKGSKGKGRGATKSKAPEKPTSRIFNTAVRIRITADSRKKMDVLSLLEASREVTRKLEAEAASLSESVA